MSFKDEINKIRDDNQPEYYTDDEVFDFLIKRIYKSIKNSIKKYFTDNPTKKSYSMTHSAEFLSERIEIPDDKEFANYKSDSKIYKKIRIEEGYDTPKQNYVSLGENILIFHCDGVLGKNRMIELSPIGKMVYETLKKIAAKDGIEMDIKAVYTYGISRKYSKLKKHAEYHELGEWFSDKKPLKMRGGFEHGDIEVTVKFNL